MRENNGVYVKFGCLLNKRLVLWKLKQKARIKPRSVDAGRRKKAVATELAALFNKWQL